MIRKIVFQRLQKRYVTGMVVIVSILFLVFSGITLRISYEIRNRDLQTRLDEVSTLAMESLSSAIWEFKHEYVSNFIDSLFMYEEIVFARLFNSRVDIT